MLGTRLGRKFARPTAFSDRFVPRAHGGAGPRLKFQEGSCPRFEALGWAVTTQRNTDFFEPARVTHRVNVAGESPAPRPRDPLPPHVPRDITWDGVVFGRRAKR